MAYAVATIIGETGMPPDDVREMSLRDLQLVLQYVNNKPY